MAKDQLDRLAEKHGIELEDKLAAIQQKLVAPKGQFNAFGKYKYRSCEDILTALKTVLNGLTLTLTDEIVHIGDRYYVKATATVTDGLKAISTVAYAREEELKKGMDASQITGSASSYARKYALNGLFCIDDSRDADHEDNTTIQYIDKAQVNNLLDLIAVTESNLDKFTKWLGVESLEKIPLALYPKAKNALLEKQKGI